MLKNVREAVQDAGDTVSLGLIAVGLIALFAVALASTALVVASRA